MKQDEITSIKTSSEVFDQQLKTMDDDIAHYESVLYTLRLTRAEFAASRNMINENQADYGR